jgi:hypothetical protein
MHAVTPLEQEELCDLRFVTEEHNDSIFRAIFLRFQEYAIPGGIGLPYVRD